MKKYNHRYNNVTNDNNSNNITNVTNTIEKKIPSPLFTAALDLSVSPTIIYSLLGTANCPICQEKSLCEKVVTWKDCSHTIITIPHFTLE